MKFVPTMNVAAELLAPSNVAVDAPPNTSRSTDASPSMKRLRSTSTAARKHATTAGATTALTVATLYLNVVSQSQMSSLSQPMHSKLGQKLLLMVQKREIRD